MFTHGRGFAPWWYDGVPNQVAELNGEALFCRCGTVLYIYPFDKISKRKRRRRHRIDVRQRKKAGTY